MSVCCACLLNKSGQKPARVRFPLFPPFMSKRSFQKQKAEILKELEKRKIPVSRRDRSQLLKFAREMLEKKYEN